MICILMRYAKSLKELEVLLEVILEFWNLKFTLLFGLLSVYGETSFELFDLLPLTACEKEMCWVSIGLFGDIVGRLLLS